eukprot:scaffold23127_cov112-Isochrysis_galbana.AAC.3
MGYIGSDVSSETGTASATLSASSALTSRPKTTCLPSRCPAGARQSKPRLWCFRSRPARSSLKLPPKTEAEAGPSLPPCMICPGNSRWNLPPRPAVPHARPVRRSECQQMLQQRKAAGRHAEHAHDSPQATRRLPPRDLVLPPHRRASEHSGTEPPLFCAFMSTSGKLSNHPIAAAWPPAAAQCTAEWPADDAPGARAKQSSRRA